MNEHDIALNCACFNLRKAARALTRSYSEVLKPTGLKGTQFSILVAVSLGDGALPIARLAEMLGLERTTLTRNLRPLEKQGLVEILPEGYRRARGLVLTEKGRRVLDEAIPLWKKAQAETVSRIGAERWQAMRQELDVLTADG